MTRVRSQTKFETAARPQAAESRPHVPNLRRFAVAPCFPQNFAGHLTTICAAVLAAAHRQTERLQGIFPEICPKRSARVEALLGVISYCYAKGLFDSGEIERRLWEDEAFLATFGNEIPSAQRIRGFRRRHRENILAITEEALQHYWQRVAKQSPPGPPGPVELSEAGRRKAEELLDMANAIDQLASE